MTQNTSNLQSCIDSPSAGFIHPIGKERPMVFCGWAFFQDKPATEVKFSIDKKELSVNQLNDDRPDVRIVFPLASGLDSPLGFKYEFPIPPDLGAGEHKLEVHARSGSSNWQLIAELDFNAVDAEKLSFSERYACIPAYLRFKVNGFLEEDTFHKIGSGIAEEILSKVENLNDCKDILDFGSGIGRVMHPLSEALPRAQFTGFDIDPSMVAWSSFLLNDSRFSFTSKHKDLESNSFDFLYAISVFTHLDETADYWLKEIKRLLKPDGRALISYIDETLFAELAGSKLLRDVPKGTKLEKYFVVGKGTKEGDASMGTWYTTKHWEERLEKHFKIIRTEPRGLENYQSFSLVTPRN